MTEPTRAARPSPGTNDGSNAPDSGSQVFTSRKARRAFEEAALRRRAESDPFAERLASADRHEHGVAHLDGRETDARRDDSRRVLDATHTHRLDTVPITTQTGRVRLRPDELARATDSGPVPITLPAPETLPPTGPVSLPAGFGAGTDAQASVPQASVPGTRRSARMAADTPQIRSKAKAPKSRPAAMGLASSTKPAKTRPSAKPEKQAKTKLLARPSKRQTSSPAVVGRRRSPLSRVLAKAVIMFAAAGLVATTAVPAYAQFETPTWVDPTTGKTQTLAVGAVHTGVVDRDDYGAHTISTALDTTTGSVVAPEVQALAQQLMSAVAQGRLTGSTPDHIFEIRYLAAGEAVQGCGIDYRVLQTIAFALTKFNTVGVSDINRHCTGQIEGAGTASAHYTEGGGHAVDFFRLNGQSLTGGDANSIKLIEDLDGVVPTDATVGQVNCRSSLSLGHFKQIDDTCNHLHVDFLDAKAATLLG